MTNEHPKIVRWSEKVPLNPDDLNEGYVRLGYTILVNDPIGGGRKRELREMIGLDGGTRIITDINEMNRIATELFLGGGLSQREIVRLGGRIKYPNDHK